MTDTVVQSEHKEDKMELPGYQILRELGQGGMATVYLAVQQGFEREIALKVMSRSLAADDEYRQRFYREAKIVGQLSHPHIVPVYDVGYHDGHLYLAMEYLKCGDLKQRIKQNLTLTQALAISKQIAQALSFAHEHGFIHRDVKPDNILFRDEHTAVLTDFGIARTQDASGEVTVVQSIIGTPRYMSPEQALGEPLDARTDIYSLGVVLYEMLTGKLPFTGTNAAVISVQHCSQPIPLLADDLAVVQPLINMLMAKLKTERIERANDVTAAIDDLQENLATGGETRIHKRGQDQSNDESTDNTTEKLAATTTGLWPWLLLSGIIVTLAGVLAVYYFSATQQPSEVSPIAENKSNNTTHFYISALDQFVEDPKDLSTGKYVAIAWARGYRAKEVILDSPLASFPKVELEPIVNPTPKEFDAFTDALDNVAPKNSQEFLKIFPNSPLGDILAVKALNEDARVPRLRQFSIAGDETALLALSELTDKGWGVVQDKNDAKKLARESAQYGYSLGEFQYGVLLLENEPTGKEAQDAIRYLNRAADNGFFLALTRLGIIYVNGEHVNQNVNKGVDYLNRAAAQSDRSALYYLGRVYDAGIGLSADREKATEYFQKAARLGHPEAPAYLK